MLYGELGRMPLDISVYKRIISYWHKLEITTLPVKSSKLVYLTNYVDFYWVQNIETLLNKCGLSYVFQNPLSVTTHYLVNQIERTLKDHFLQSWQVCVRNSTIGNYYQYLKGNPTLKTTFYSQALFLSRFCDSVLVITIYLSK